MLRITNPNPVEEAFRLLAEAEGWDVTKRGWPDFLCRRNGELMAVEVKGRNDGLSPQQYETISDLRRAGIPTFVWNPEEGFTEVGPPIGESVFSLRATLAQIREAYESPRQPQLMVDAPVVQWTFAANDWHSIGAIKRACLKTHPEHKKRRTLGTSGSWCSDLVFLSQQYAVEQIAQMAELGAETISRQLNRSRERMVTFQHEQLHRAIGVDRRCTGCPEAA